MKSKKLKIENIRINDPYIDHFPSVEELVDEAKIVSKCQGFEPVYNLENELTEAEIKELFEKR